MPDGPALATLGDLAAYLQVDEADLAGAEPLLAQASSLVRNVGLDQRVDLVEDDDVELYGSGDSVLLLPELPVHEVTAVRFETSAGDLDDPLVNFTDYRLEKGADGARAILRARGRCWPKGAPIHVTYSHGYALEPPGSGDVLDVPLLPEALKLIVLRIAARGVFNPGSLTNSTTGKVSQGFGMDSKRVATLTDADRADLAPWRAEDRS